MSNWRSSWQVFNDDQNRQKDVYVISRSHNEDLLSRVYTHLYINGLYIDL